MPVPSILRRCLAAGLFLALLAPILLPAAVGPMPGRPGLRAAGAACCGPKACCAAEASCATGRCERGAHLGATPAGASATSAKTPAPGPRIAVACPGPAPSTTVAERDPMLPAPETALPVAAEPRRDFLHVAAASPIRNDAPSVPPPRV
ncbi:MAG TPA: hypothetical protein VFS09_04860 [Candidatus Eisenbacteria bacterium]|nr:hypothetical protein [Candidatus Eisenbacteria bacterium]